MSANVYEKLRMLLDCHPFGCPPAPEILEILSILFTEEEADVALGLTFGPLPVEVIAERAGVSPEYAHLRLESMADKALAFSRVSKGVRRYALQAPMGILETTFWKDSCNDDTERVRQLSKTYIPLFMKGIGSATTAFLRTIPIQEEIERSDGVLPYEKIYALVDQARTVAVLPCSCREVKGHCERGAPRESCMVFDESAEFLVQRCFGQCFTLDEAKQKIRECDQAGLVHQVSDIQSRPFVICACCPCCCKALHAKAELGNRHIMARSPYAPVRDPERCTYCLTCAEKRCPVNAITIADEVYMVDAVKCIGCGLCATGCPNDAVKMERSAEAPIPPVNTQEWAMLTLQDHGRLERFMELMTPGEKQEPKA